MEKLRRANRALDRAYEMKEYLATILEPAPPEEAPALLRRHRTDAAPTHKRHMPHTSTGAAPAPLCGRAGWRRWWNVFSSQLRSSRWSMTTRCPASAAQRAT